MYGSWGIFYDILKLDLARQSFGGAKWTQYYFSLDTPNWPSLVDVPNCRRTRRCPGKQLLFRDFRFPSNDAIQSDIKPMKMQEFVVGADHELNSTLSVGLRYVHKQVDRAIEDIGNLDAEGNETYVIGNPGIGPNTTYITPSEGRVIPLPKAKRDYDAVELSLNKRMANHWSGRASYMWSRLYGNYAGLSQSDENGRVNPNIGRSFDYPLMSFDENLQRDDRRPADRPDAPGQAAAHLRRPVRRRGGRQLVPGERHPDLAAGRVHRRQQLPDLLPAGATATAARRSSTSSTCSRSTS